jgi:uncharacterized protein (TIGR02679 family)
MTSDRRLVRLLGGEELAWVVQRARRRIERGEALVGTVTLADASEEQRRAAALLLGRRPRPGSGLSIRLEEVDALVRRSGAHPEGLASAVVALTGPVRDRAAEQAAVEEAWRHAFAPLHTLVARRPELAPWLDGLLTTGVVRRQVREPAEAAALLAAAAAVVEALPTEPEPAGHFAARVLSSAHALDDDRPLATLVLGAARVLGKVPDGAGAAWRRAVWASVGLLRDELSSTVLALGLPGEPTTATGRALGALSEAGEPAVLTLRQLARDEPRLALSGRTVSVCENPVVVAIAADRLGRACAPLVCVSGQPGAAATTLLHALAAAGARLRYHGDFDWGGVRIGNLLVERLPVRPWRFDAAAYRAAMTALDATRELAGAPVEARWDPELAPALRACGRVVEEEQVVDDLLVDLAG